MNRNKACVNRSRISGYVKSCLAVVMMICVSCGGDDSGDESAESVLHPRAYAKLKEVNYLSQMMNVDYDSFGRMSRVTRPVNNGTDEEYVAFRYCGADSIVVEQCSWDVSRFAPNSVNMKSHEPETVCYLRDGKIVKQVEKFYCPKEFSPVKTLHSVDSTVYDYQGDRLARKRVYTKSELVSSGGRAIYRLVADELYHWNGGVLDKITWTTTSPGSSSLYFYEVSFGYNTNRANSFCPYTNIEFVRRGGFFLDHSLYLADMGFFGKCPEFDITSITQKCTPQSAESEYYFVGNYAYQYDAAGNIVNLDVQTESYSVTVANGEKHSVGGSQYKGIVFSWMP